MSPGLADRLAGGDATVAVWGCGYIGLSALLAFADAGVPCVGVDRDERLVARLSEGAVDLVGFERWVPGDLGGLVADGRARFLTAPDETVASAPAHLICVNTDRGRDPDPSNLADVAATLSTLLAGREALVAVESTVSVPWLPDLEAALPPPVHLAVAPRRDWFLDADRSLRLLPRVVGGATPAATEAAAALYGHVCDDIVLAPDWRHASLVKSVENTMRFVGIVLANQLALAMPDLDVAEVLRLAATKWNVPLYHPSLGVGGYCVPLGPRYLLDAADPSDIPLVTSCVAWDAGYAERLADEIVATYTPRSVAVLGVSYAPGTKIARLSPAVALADALVARGCRVGVHDPYFSARELADHTVAEPIDYPGGLAGADLVVVQAAHACYADLPAVVAALPDPPPVLDNLGELRPAFAGTGLDYREVGSATARATRAATSAATSDGDRPVVSTSGIPARR